MRRTMAMMLALVGIMAVGASQGHAATLFCPPLPVAMDDVCVCKVFNYDDKTVEGIEIILVLADGTRSAKFKEEFDILQNNSAEKFEVIGAATNCGCEVLKVGKKQRASLSDIRGGVLLTTAQCTESNR